MADSQAGSHDAAAVADALGPLSRALAADQYRLDVTTTGEREVRLSVVALEGACADCLVPKEIAVRMAQQQLASLGTGRWSVEFDYPADAGH